MHRLSSVSLPHGFDGLDSVPINRVCAAKLHKASVFRVEELKMEEFRASAFYVVELVVRAVVGCGALYFVAKHVLPLACA